MANTSFHYLYRDADNYKASRTIVLAGEPQPGDLDTIAACLDDGDSFIPSQVGLEDIQAELEQFDDPESWQEFNPNAPMMEPAELITVNPSDHPWHELNPEEDIETTDAPADFPWSFAELVAAFRAVTWDGSASPYA